MSDFYEYYFFLSSHSNNDLSDNKRMLSEVSPGLLGHQQLLSDWWPLCTTTLSFTFDVMEVLEDPVLLILWKIVLY